MVRGHPGLALALSALALAHSSSSEQQGLAATPLATVVFAANASADERNAAEMIADELGNRTCAQALPLLNASASSSGEHGPLAFSHGAPFSHTDGAVLQPSPAA